MRIGIDISQIVYEGTGVATYVKKLVATLVAIDTNNDYVLFASSLRRRNEYFSYYRTLKANSRRVRLKVVPIPPTVLDVLWNILHVIPIEWFIGRVDVFWSSDWTQPPLANAKGVTTIHDLAVLRFPASFHKKILAVQKRRMKWVSRECSSILCDSQASKRDVVDALHIDASKVHVIYPGI